MVGHVGPDTLEATAVARFPNDPVQTSDGLHWNILGLYGAAVNGLREALRAEPAIRSIGVDSWAVDYGLLREGRLLGNPFHYRDARTERGVAAVHERMPHAELYARNGLQFLPFNTLYQLAAEPADLLAFADSALLIPDLFGFWLTGEAASPSRRTHRRPACCARAEAGTKSSSPPWACRAASCPRSSLRASGSEPCGPRSPPRSARTPTSRSPRSARTTRPRPCVAVPMRPDAAAYISCGTWGLVGVEVERPVLTAEALAANFTNEGGVGRPHPPPAATSWACGCSAKRCARGSAPGTRSTFRRCSTPPRRSPARFRSST